MPDEPIHEVRIEDSGSVDVVHGRRLALGLEDAGVDILHRCGGNARCATCRVEILRGEPTPVTSAEEGRLTQLSARKDTTRLACQVRVTSDMTIRICNRLSAHPELEDAGPRPIEWPADREMPPEE